MKTYTLHGFSGRRTGLSGPHSPLCGEPASQRTVRTTFKPLSKLQKATLGRLAGDAYQAEIRRGNVTVSPNLVKSKQLEDWRHDEQEKACGLRSLREANQSHYLDLRRHFLNLIGTPAASARAYRDGMRTGPVKVGSAAASPHQIEDTHEARALWRFKLNEALTEFRDVINEAYIAAICRSQCQGRGLDDATAEELKNLHSTARNRGRSKRAKAKGRAVMAEYENQPF
jgi:hypothetical protein